MNQQHQRPWLNPEELEELSGFKKKGKQREALDMMGIDYHMRPDGKLIVTRSSLGEHGTHIAAANGADEPDMSAI